MLICCNEWKNYLFVELIIVDRERTVVIWKNIIHIVIGLQLFVFIFESLMMFYVIKILQHLIYGVCDLNFTAL